MLPMLLGLLGGGLGTAGALGSIGALGGAALGSGLGSFAQTGDLGEGIKTGIGAYLGGAALGALAGGAAGAGTKAAADAVTGGVTGGATGAAGAAGGAGGAAAAPGMTFGTGLQSAVLPPPSLNPSLLSQSTNFMKTAPGIGSVVGGIAATPMPSGGSYSYDKLSPVQRYSPGPASMPGAGYQPGRSGEFDYGFSPPPGGTQGTEPTKYAGGGLLSGYSNPSMMGQTLQRMAEGGIASMVPKREPEMDRSMDMEDDMDIMPAASSGPNEKEVIVEAIKAIKGMSGQPEIALGMFIKKYGEQALGDLVERVQSGELDETIQNGEGRLKGPGDGMNDMIPASVDDGQDVLLSDGEYVVSADVVSGLGNGSTDAGAKALDEMMSRVRQARGGSPEQPEPVSQGEMLPA
jgi:hypothetical protein